MAQQVATAAPGVFDLVSTTARINPTRNRDTAMSQDDHDWYWQDRKRRARLIWNQQVRNGGQGRNQTIDTRISSSLESAVRREKGEEAERVFDGLTAPPWPTEPIPNPLGRRRPSEDRTFR